MLKVFLAMDISATVLGRKKARVESSAGSRASNRRVSPYQETAGDSRAGPQCLSQFLFFFGKRNEKLYCLYMLFTIRVYLLTWLCRRLELVLNKRKKTKQVSAGHLCNALRCCLFYVLHPTNKIKDVYLYYIYVFASQVKIIIHKLSPLCENQKRPLSDHFCARAVHLLALNSFCIRVHMCT